MTQYRVDSGDTTSVAQLRKEVLKQLVDEQVILAEAARQGVTVPKAQVDQSVEQQLQSVKSRLGSAEQFQKALEQEKLTEPALRQKYATELRKQLLVTKMVDREVQSKTSVSDTEVRTYFAAHRDSIGKAPERLRLAAIVLAFEPDSTQVKRARARADSLWTAIMKGQAFADVASAASDDPSGARGGDLGTFARGTMVPEFEDAVFALKPMDISKPIRSRYGFHVVQVLEHQAATDSSEERVHVRHILVQMKPTPKDEERSRERAITVRDSVIAGGDFASFARRYSADSASRDSGGALGDIPLPNLPPTFQEPVSGLRVGEISVPLKGEAGYYVFKLLGRTPETDYKYEDIKDDLRKIVLNQKLRDSYQRWLDRIRKNVNVELKD
jgi:peptidyl-prolyl cis-trans isomerase SurA